MSVIRSEDAVDHVVHGVTFGSYVASSRGSAQLCAWRLTVPAGLRGVAHRPTREEVILVLHGELRINIDGAADDLHPGDVALVLAGTELRVDGGPRGASAWVTTTQGLEAVMADGGRFAPPWAT